ncbi:MAG: SPOR domain-containing protein [Cellvibrionaceae bacterium]|nr:SPOR domain-containing protein [Cellvibrionaceae bacterium]
MSKSRPNTRKKSKKNRLHAPLWAWLVIGLLIAIVITLLIYMLNQTALPQRVEAATDSAAQDTLPQPRFDFYEILKQQKVDVPDRSAEVKAAQQARVDFYLQVASFRNPRDANALRAKLILLDINTEIETVKTGDSTWHRVVSGPFASRSKMAKARSTLASMDLHALLLKR